MAQPRSSVNVNDCSSDSLPIKPLMSPKEVSAILAVSVGTVKGLMRSRKLPAVKVGRQWRVSGEALSLYVKP